MPRVSARNFTSKPFRVLTKVRTNCSHFVKTPSLVLAFFFASVARFFGDFLVFLLPLQRRMSVAFGFQKFKQQIKLRPSYTCITITVFGASCLVNEIISFLFLWTSILCPYSYFNFRNSISTICRGCRR